MDEQNNPSGSAPSDPNAAGAMPSIPPAAEPATNEPAAAAAQPAGAAPSAPQESQPQADQKCVTCGTTASGGTCVACGQGELTCTCQPGSSQGAPSSPMGGAGGAPTV